MEIKFDIEDEKVQTLSDAAKGQIPVEAKTYLEAILDEASRIEESRRTENANPEITSSVIREAVVFAKRFGMKQKGKKKPVWLQIINVISSIATGGLFQIDKFTNIGFFLAFLCALVITIGASVYLIFIEA